MQNPVRDYSNIPAHISTQLAPNAVTPSCQTTNPLILPFLISAILGLVGCDVFGGKDTKQKPSGPPKDTTVTVRATAEDTTHSGNYKNMRWKVIEPSGRISAKRTSAVLDVELSKTTGERTIIADAFRPDTMRADTLVVPADSDVDTTARLVQLPNCSDGWDNDHDGRVDVWHDINGDKTPVGPADEGDPGCTSKDDNSEENWYYQVTFFRFEPPEDTFFVSSDPDHWRGIPIADHKFKSTVSDAVGNIFMERSVKVDSTQTNEAYAVEFRCGQDANSLNHVNTTQIVEDDQSVHGWHKTTLVGVNPDVFFADGRTTCVFLPVHKNYVNNNPGDGEDDVISGHPNEPEDVIAARFRWFIEREDRPEEKRAQTRDCQQTNRGRVCVSAGTGFPNRQ